MPSAARLRWARFRIAVVAFSALLILGVLLSLLAGGKLFRNYASLYVYMPDSAGLAPKASVRLNGIPIGEVERVEFSGAKEPERTILVELRAETRYLPEIPIDSTASLSAENVIGDKFLDITKGRSRTHVPPGATIPFTPEPDVMKRLDLAEFEARMRAIDQMLADIQAGKTTAGQLFAGDRIYRDTVAAIANLEHAVESAASSQRAFGRLLYTEEALTRVRAGVLELDRRIAAAGRASYLRDTAQYDRLHARLAGLRKSVANLNAGQGRWGAFLASDAAYNGWVRSLGGLVRGIDEFNAGEGRLGPFFVSAQPYESLAGSSRELAATLAEFREDPGKFVRISIF